MKRFFPAIVFVLAAFWIGASFVPAKKSHDGIGPWRLRKNSGAGRWPG